MMMSTSSSSRNAGAGFSLVEMAVVMVILGLLLTGLMMPLSVSLEQTRRSDARKHIAEIIESLYGFAAANDRLPCPAVPGSGGVEAPAGGGACANGGHGFVPGRTLGLNGYFGADSLLEDPWGNPYRYVVSMASTDFTVVNGATLTSIGDLAICDDANGSATATATTCQGGEGPLAEGLVAVIYSQGRDWRNFSGPDQIENGGEESLDGYRISNDQVFVSREFDDSSDDPFDDIVAWISPYLLVSRLLAAGQLP